MVTMKGVLRVNCLDLGDELSERLLVGFQDTSKVTHYYVHDLGVKYSMSKTTPKEKEQGYHVYPNYLLPITSFTSKNY